MNDVETAPLTLVARDLEDLAVIASMVQDALAPLADIAWLREEESFVLVVNRFRWEQAGERGPYSRTLAGLRFDAVEDARMRGLDRKDPGRILSLLTIAYDAGEAGGPGSVVLHFSGGAAVWLQVRELRCALHDLGEPWPTQWKPAHSDETAG